MSSLKQKQRDAVRAILNFNKRLGGEDMDALMCDQWKVLIYDRSCRDIITPLLTVNQLRQHGITLYLDLHQERDPIPDVAAIYVIAPTNDNVRRVAQDAGKALYRAMHVNFISPTPRVMLEDFARETLRSGGAAHISRVFDQRLNFVSLEPTLATLGMTRTFAAYNDPACSERDITDFVNQVCDGALALFATHGAVPVIRAPKEGAAAMVAQRLCDRIREHLRGGSDLFRTPSSLDPGALAVPAGSSPLRRPVLLILDRTADLVAPVQHGVAYQALVDDVLRHRLNRVSVPVGDGEKPRTFHLDTETDAFWRENAAAAFPEAVESNGRELAETTELEKKLLAGASGQPEDEADQQTQQLQRAVDQVQPLLARKKQLETHTALLQACMDSLSKRHIPRFFEVEDDIIAGSLAGDAARDKVMEALRGEGSAEDKVRACLVWALACSPGDRDVEKVEAALRVSLAPDEDEAGAGAGAAQGVDDAAVAALAWMRKHRQIARLSASHSASTTDVTAARQSGGGLASLWSVADSVTGHAASLLQKATSTVKGLLPRSKRLFAARALLAMCTPRECRGEFESYLYLDPQAARGNEVPEEARVGQFDDAVLFVVGGGCYTEYHNVMEHVADKAGKNVTYATTEMVSPRAFVDQLAALGKA